MSYATAGLYPLPDHPGCLTFGARLKMTSAAG
jgi:hypothetical protein